MNLNTFLHEKNFGLYYPMGNVHVGWIPSMASDASVDIDEGEDDFGVILLTNVKADDYVVFREDAEVERAPDDDEGYIVIKDIEGRNWFFKAFKILTLDEVFS